MRDSTEGVPFSQMRMPFLKRNLPPNVENAESYDRFYRRLVNHDGLVIRICANSYHLLYEPHSYDWWWRPAAPATQSGGDRAKEEAALKDRRHDRFREKLVNNPGWAHGLSKDEVDRSNQRFRTWIKGHDEDKADAKTEAGDKDDTEMADADASEMRD
jgi:paired amphipathic helix protein Sin3a